LIVLSKPKHSLLLGRLQAGGPRGQCGSAFVFFIIFRIGIGKRVVRGNHHIFVDTNVTDFYKLGDGCLFFLQQRPFVCCFGRRIRRLKNNSTEKSAILSFLLTLSISFLVSRT